jgi:hypothetical protein
MSRKDAAETAAYLAAERYIDAGKGIRAYPLMANAYVVNVGKKWFMVEL